MEKSEYEFQMESEFPDYQTFLNFFKDLTGTIQTTDNAYLIDQLVKLVFLNIKVDGKNISGYTLQETFESFKTLDFLFGVEHGVMLEIYL